MFRQIALIIVVCCAAYAEAFERNCFDRDGLGKLFHNITSACEAQVARGSDCVNKFQQCLLKHLSYFKSNGNINKVKYMDFLNHYIIDPNLRDNLKTFLKSCNNEANNGKNDDDKSNAENDAEKEKYTQTANSVNYLRCVGRIFNSTCSDMAAEVASENKIVTDGIVRACNSNE